MQTLIEASINYAPQILILVFLTITFLQSGIDKLTDWSGNLTFLKEHFSKTFLKNTVPLMLAIIMLGEIFVGILSIIAIFQIYLYQITTLGFFAAVLAAKTLLALLFGQRIAKDYAGAMTIAVYFIITVIGVFLMAKA